MGTKKTMHVGWVLVLSLAWFMSCAPKEEPPVEPVQRGELELKEETISTLIDLMVEEKGALKNPQKKKRSLAQHIMRDHAVLRVYFQNQQFYEMARAMGEDVTINGEKMTIDELRKFWFQEYDAKYMSLTPEQKAVFAEKYQIELEIYTESVSLWDIVSEEMITKDIVVDGIEMQHKIDAHANEVFKFTVVLLEDGVTISNSNGGGEWPRDHSWIRPWI